MASVGINKAATDKKTVVAEVVRSGSKILLPEDMSIRESIKVLEAKEIEEEQVVNLVEDFDVFVFEGLYALSQVLDKRYGWYQQVATPGFFGDNPPAMISVDVDVDKTVQVPWGAFLVPNIPKSDGMFNTAYNKKEENGMITFRLTAKLKKKHSAQFHSLCAAIRDELSNFSLYRGKAITIRFTGEDNEDLQFPKPEFSRIPKMKEEDLIFSDDVQAVIKANLYTPIEKTAIVRAQKIPLRRGVLLAGPYGVGKTLIASMIATKATLNGWTYVYCQKASEFPQVVRFAQRYQPAVVFCEDIDRVTYGERDEAMDNILNTIDGVDSKAAEIIIILTTNELEKIHQAMLRPGRLDAVINVKRPDAKAVGRLIRAYAGVLLPADAKLDRIGRILAGNTPAVIREVVERSKLAAISLSSEDDPWTLSEEAFIISAQTMKDQLELLEKKQVDDPKPMEVLGNCLAEGILKGVNTALRNQPRLLEIGRISGEHVRNTITGSAEEVDSEEDDCLKMVHTS